MTYVPDWMPQPSTEQAVSLARRIGFASVVSSTAGAPAVAHVPVYVDTTGEQVELRFHLAVKNPLVELLHERLPTLLIFRGPDGYISPSWYDHENVPTWDYAFVHMSGRPRAMSRRELSAHVAELVAHFDPGLEVSNAYVEKYLDDIRGFALTGPDVQPVMKLSQDKSVASIDGVLDGLRDRGEDQLANAVAETRPLKRQQ